MTDILVLGHEGSGKTLLVRRMLEICKGLDEANISAENTIPTVGVDITCLVTGEREYVIRELGSALASKWSSYLSDACGVVFVVDVADLGAVASAMTLLFELLQYHLELSQKEVLVALNKTDLCDTSTVIMAENLLRLEELQRDDRIHISIQYGSSLDLSLARHTKAWIKHLAKPIE